MAGLGVVAESRLTDPFRRGIGVAGAGFALMDASDRGGDGGVASSRNASAFERGGVDAVGDDSVVAEVAVSDTGERGRRESAASRLDVLRW